MAKTFLIAAALILFSAQAQAAGAPMSNYEHDQRMYHPDRYRDYKADKPIKTKFMPTYPAIPVEPEVRYSEPPRKAPVSVDHWPKVTVLLELKTGETLRCSKLETDKAAKQYNCIRPEGERRVAFSEEKPAKPSHIPGQP